MGVPKMVPPSKARVGSLRGLKVRVYGFAVWDLRVAHPNSSCSAQTSLVDAGVRNGHLRVRVFGAQLNPCAFSSAGFRTYPRCVCFSRQTVRYCTAKPS